MTNVLVFLDTDEIDVDILAISDDVDKLKAAALDNEAKVRGVDDLVAEWVTNSVDGTTWMWGDEFGTYIISEPSIARV